jgi:zinc D-Ala-D-Ala dipeptidase
MKFSHKAFFVLCLTYSLVYFSPAFSLPTGFVYVKNIIPNIKVELRYYSNNNFTGKRVDGYNKPKCIFSRKGVLALAKVQKKLNESGLGLKIFDAYRPQWAVDCFEKWAKDLNDTKMKAEYYPDIDKKDLFKLGYIAAKSSHSRGGAIDLTIISLKDGKELDMGSAFDLFSKKSWPSYKKLLPQQMANRLLLRLIMEKYGFLPYQYEWWHFFVKNEPFPNTYFDFPIE